MREQKIFATGACVLGLLLSVLASGCKGKEHGDTAPPPAKVVEQTDMNLVSIDAGDVAKFPTVTAESVQDAPVLHATGSVSPDVSREVPVISLANGRVVGIKARLDDNVTKGQLLFQVESPDISTAFNAYLKAVNDEQLARKSDLRAKDLFEHGALSQAMLDQADDAENDAKSDLNAAEEQLRLLGVDKRHPGSVVNVYAPITGVIIGQNITNAAAAGMALSGSATAFTIADISSVWILCDVYENDIPKLQLGQEAAIHVDAYPGLTLTGRINDIGPVLDPSLRTAKVRIVVRNPGMLKLGMFVNATFTGRKKENFAAVPAEAVLHLHDRDWVFVPKGDHSFQRTEVQAGPIVSGDRQVILSGLQPGQQVIRQALLLETAGAQ